MFACQNELPIPVVVFFVSNHEFFFLVFFCNEQSRDHEMIVPHPFGCFRLMHLIEKSIQVGALFSPKLFVPKEIWQQDQVKLAGVPLKMEIFHQLKHRLEKLSVRHLTKNCWCSRKVDDCFHKKDACIVARSVLVVR